MCELCEGRTNAVAGKGSHESKIMFVGEAPGQTEDIMGEPFVGAAGRKLSNALSHAGISRDSVYITNVVKCRPPNNRFPAQKEIDACRIYLESEIRIIKPKIVCVMGNAAYGSLLGGTNITKMRGKIVERAGQQYFLTIHPAAAIYRPELESVLKKDMVELAHIADIQ